jgi:hypothetical protein
MTILDTILAAAVCSVVPAGEGLPANGSGVVHVMQTGAYTFHGATVKNGVSLRYLLAGDWVNIQASTPHPEWTRPDRVREVIPMNLLYSREAILATRR